MLEPDFWKGRGRYSKRATSRRVKDGTPYTSRDEEEAGTDSEG